MMKIGHHANTLSPGRGLAVFAGYVAVAIAAAAVLLSGATSKRRERTRTGA